MIYFKRFLWQATLCLVSLSWGRTATAQTITWDTAAAGGGHTVALKSDGTVWTWGYNGIGQLGDNSTTQRNTPVQVLGTGGSGFLTDVIAIAAGSNYTAALKSDGTVWTWGDNSYGQLGDNTTTRRSTPVQVSGTGGSGFLTDVKAIAAGIDHMVALKSDGTVWTWGYNQNGQLGDNSTTRRTTPVQVLGTGGSGFLTGVKAIAAGNRHTVALKSDGMVWAWGYNGYGQLGDNTSLTERSTPVQVLGPGGSGFLTDVKAIATGNYHTLFLKNNGTVWGCGYNDFGQLGDNTTTRRSTPVQVSGTGGSGFLTDVKAIAAGGRHTVALKSDGTVWAWGYNNYGQLGDNTLARRITPTAITLNSSGTVAIASGSSSSHTILLRSGQATLFLTGMNDYGQLGNGTTANSSTYASITCGNLVGAAPAGVSFSSQVLPASGTRLSFQSACYAGVDVTPNGSSPASGTANARLWVEAAEPTTTTNLYTRRHYEITPATNASTATGRVTLYALQSEFTNYNGISTAALPTGPTDAAGIGRLRIYKYSGTSNNGSGLPAFYTGTPVVIDPADVDIVWNSTYDYWQISFDVTGFSGFFIGAADAVILPVKLTSFTAAKQANNSVLTWKIAQEENIATYTIERSADGRSFTTVGSVASLGNATIARSYNFTDAAPLKGANYYRLQMVEKDGKVNYSDIRLLNFGSQFVIALYPNPAKDKATITGVEAGMQIRLADAVGKMLQVQTATGTTESLLLSGFAKGLYSVQVYGANGQLLDTKRLVKE
jgi:alpha-tubulin suppressor-like RCC1 family protein